MLVKLVKTIDSSVPIEELNPIQRVQNALNSASKRGIPTLIDAEDLLKLFSSFSLFTSLVEE